MVNVNFFKKNMENETEQIDFYYLKILNVQQKTRFIENKTG